MDATSWMSTSTRMSSSLKAFIITPSYYETSSIGELRQASGWLETAPFVILPMERNDQWALCSVTLNIESCILHALSVDLNAGFRLSVLGEVYEAFTLRQWLLPWYDHSMIRNSLFRQRMQKEKDSKSNSQLSHKIWTSTSSTINQSN